MKRIIVSVVMILFFLSGGVQVQAKEDVSQETSETTIFSGDGVIKLELSEDWLLFNSESEYDDEFYDEWQVDKEIIEETLANSQDGIVAIHKYENRIITIIRTKEESFDWRGISDKQFDSFLNEIKAAGKQERNGVVVEYNRTYENDISRYVVYDQNYEDGVKTVMYQTGLGNELVHICLDGDSDFVENQTAQNKWVDKVSYEKTIEMYDSQKKSDESFFRASGAWAVRISIVIIIAATVIHYKGNKKNKKS